jgi:DNA-binding protein YbaB
MKVGAEMSFSVVKLEQQAGELDAELAAARYSAQSADKIATATVSGQGRLLGLVIADHALRSSHPQQVGPAVLQAVTAARRQSSAVSLTKLRTVLDKDQEWQPEPQPTPNEALVARPAPHRVTAGDDEESFEELDFVNDPGDEQRSRW